jgi:hypothetical protein
MCGTPNTSTTKCLGCNAPRKDALACGVALVEGHLSQAILLNDLDKGFQIDVTYRDCGRPDEYIPKDVIVSLRDCRVLRKWIPALETFGNDDYEPLMLCLEIGCDVKLQESM